ncbi:phage gp6-like head-tail connector protein [Streptococcus sp. sy004]|uniref:phage gp6-like head-tail connector protein n=1 Tax=Streptococcus sp. sy004 TaxID=2600149 RepID=UPI0011B6347F|nr:phage gp6-like head-tail connector protein [Streptococcus sp. sy004]TWT12071.1 phage gp6-like head-tail connector protein [Streptococcus sp. sy004]
MTIEIGDELLTAFKERMRIFHDAEDTNLRRILAGSVSALNERFGLEVRKTGSGQELILERSRFVYNDKLELFETAFASELNRFAVTHTLKEEINESKNEASIS